MFAIHWKYIFANPAETPEQSKYRPNSDGLKLAASKKINAKPVNPAMNFCPVKTIYEFNPPALDLYILIFYLSTTLRLVQSRALLYKVAYI